jgi:hypothetical protein
MDKGKEWAVMNAGMDSDRYIENDIGKILDCGYGQVQSSELVEATRAPRVLPREGLSYLMPTTPVSPIGAKGKEDMSNYG